MKLFPFLLSLIAAAAVSRGASPSGAAADPAAALDAYTVTGTRERALLRETPVSVGILTPETIRQTAPLHPGQLLGQFPGVAVAVTNGEDRWPAAVIPRTPEEIAAAAAQRPEYRDARAVRTIKAGETLEWTIETPFEPKKAVVDPDVRTLMLGRKTAGADVTAAAAR